MPAGQGCAYNGSSGGRTNIEEKLKTVGEKDQEEGTRRDQKTQSDMTFLFTNHKFYPFASKRPGGHQSLETARC